jgi:acid phosphatase
VLFVFTDTSPFVTSYYTNPPTFSDLNQQDTSLQLQWLNTTLSVTAETWKIVVGHHPVYSVGLHGNTPELIQRFKPIFLNNKVDFYLSGHDHDLEHLKVAGESVNYLVSGGGSENYPILSNTNSLFAQPTPGLLVMTVYPDKSESYFYNQNGELLYQYSHKKQP